jgi:ketosteroid isomerase-like protein
MNEPANIETVRRSYADFGRGDIPALLAALDPDVEWIDAGPDAIAYAGTRRGLAPVREFFATRAASGEVRIFEPREFLAQGDRVVVLGGWTGRVKATGRGYASEWAMAWTVKNGRVTAFRSYEDTHAVAMAFAG